MSQTKKWTKAAQKQLDARVSKAYGRACNGVQVSILDLGKIQDAGRKAALAGATDEELETAIAAFVSTIRKN